MKKRIMLALAGLLLIIVSRAIANAPIPNPVLVFTGQDTVKSNGKEVVRYHFDVFNKAAFPTELFAAAPELPPCGNNSKSSRTWIDLFDARGKRLNGFCALTNPEQLGDIWFAQEADTLPPSWVYIEMNDRKTNTKYKSNLAETTL